MNCPYCRTVNDASDNRCARCGRRLHGPSGRPGPALVVSHPGVANVATAVALAPCPQPEIAPPPSAAEVQPSLFNSPRDTASKVIAIPTLTPTRVSNPERESVRRPQSRSAPRRAASNSQQQLDFQEEDATQAPLEVLYCDARVALVAQRTFAAAADAIAVIVGSALFLGLAAGAGVDLAIRGNIFWLPLAMTAIVAVLYRGIWCLVNRDTPGMRFAGLRLVDFDGRQPQRNRRIIRQFAGILSLLSAGVGLIWALVDEENLTWHDHISQTFPTAD